MRLTSLLLSFLILLGSLLPHADYTELAKLPGLYEHYQLHQQRSGGKLSLADFLVMHYADRKHQKSENHEKLPFQHHSHFCLGVVFYFIPQFDFQFDPEVIRANIGFRYNSFHISSYLDSIFQPPRA